MLQYSRSMVTAKVKVQHCVIYIRLQCEYLNLSSANLTYTSHILDCNKLLSHVCATVQEDLSVHTDSDGHTLFQHKLVLCRFYSQFWTSRKPITFTRCWLLAML